ncbi:MAG TPA: TlpA disulfide reductase family protein [Candidatus Thermoplasmatota archaeon]
MPSPRFKLVVALLSLSTVMTYLAEPYLGVRTYEELRPAPPFALATIDGSTFLLADQAGKPVLLDFMATWCPPCREEMGEIRTVRSAWPAANLSIVSIDVDYSETAEQLDQFRAAYAGLNGSAEAAGWFFALDSAETYVGPQYGANALPTLVLVDGDGMVRRSWVGVVRASAIMEAVGDLQVAAVSGG